MYFICKGSWSFPLEKVHWLPASPVLQRLSKQSLALEPVSTTEDLGAHSVQAFQPSSFPVCDLSTLGLPASAIVPCPHSDFCPPEAPQGPVLAPASLYLQPLMSTLRQRRRHT